MVNTSVDPTPSDGQPSDSAEAGFARPPSPDAGGEDEDEDGGSSERWGCWGLVVCGMTTLPYSPEFRGVVFTRLMMAFSTVHFGVAFGPAALSLALRSVGCSTDADSCEEGGGCSEKLWGLISASSFLTTGVTIAALIMAVLSPLLGVLCDYTPYRKHLWRVSVGVMGVCMVSGSAVDADETVLLILFVVSIVYFIAVSSLTLVHFSYLPELNYNAEFKPRAAAVGYIWMYGTQVVSIGVVLGVTALLGLSTRTSAVVWSVVLGSSVLLLAWPANSSLRHRDAARSHPRLMRYAFVRIWDLQKETRHKFPDLFRTLVAILLFDPGLNGLIVIAASYLTNHLCFESSQVSMVVGVAVVSALPGVLCSSRLTAGRPQAVHRVLVMSLAAITVVTLASPFSLSSGNVGLAMLFGVMWGLCVGMVYHSSSSMLTMLVPGGQESEIAGLQLFCFKALQWLPPLTFTLLNEAASSDFAMLSLVVFFVLGGAVVWSVDVDRGIGTVLHTLNQRRGFSSDRASRFVM